MNSASSNEDSYNSNSKSYTQQLSSLLATHLGETEEKKAEASKPKREKKNSSGKNDGVSGRWTVEEHNKFLEAIAIYRRDWKKVQLHVGSRTTTQTRSHAQKYFAKLQKTVSNKEGTIPEAPTAASSPNSKPRTETAKSRKRTLNLKDDEVEPVKVKPLDSPKRGEEVTKKFIAQKESEIRDTQYQLNDYIVHPWHQFNYDINSLQPAYTRPPEELEFEFDNILPEPVEYLELPTNINEQVGNNLMRNEIDSSNDYCILNIEFPLS